MRDPFGDDRDLPDPGPLPSPEDSGEVPTGPARPFSTLRWPALAPIAEQLAALDAHFATPQIRGGGGNFSADYACVGLQLGDRSAVLRLVEQFLQLDRAVPCLWASVDLVLQLVDPETERTEAEALAGGAE